MEREFEPKKTSHFEISHVYPCRYTYWKNRHNLDKSRCERLHRRLIFKPLKSEKDQHREIKKHFSDLFKADDQASRNELTKLILDSLTHCPQCGGDKWVYIYDKVKHKRNDSAPKTDTGSSAKIHGADTILAKTCRSRKCDFIFGLDDGFTHDEFLSFIDEIFNISASCSHANASSVIIGKIRAACQIDCPCGNKDLRQFCVLETTDGFDISCDQCGNMLHIGRDKTCKSRDKTLIKSATELKPGDHLMWCRPLGYQHHAILDSYHGNNKILVYHYIKDTRKRIVKEVVDLFDSDPVYRMDYKNPTDPRIVLQRAECKLSEADNPNRPEGSPVEKNDPRAYSVFFRNCEHFATFCHTGTYKCNQWYNVWEVLVEIPVQFAKPTVDNMGGKLFGAMVSGGFMKESSNIGKVITTVKDRIAEINKTHLLLILAIFTEVSQAILDIAEERKRVSSWKLIITYSLGRLTKAVLKIVASELITHVGNFIFTLTVFQAVLAVSGVVVGYLVWKLLMYLASRKYAQYKQQLEGSTV